MPGRTGTPCTARKGREELRPIRCPRSGATATRDVAILAGGDHSRCAAIRIHGSPFGCPERVDLRQGASMTNHAGDTGADATMGHAVHGGATSQSRLRPYRKPPEPVPVNMTNSTLTRPLMEGKSRAPIDFG